MIKSKFSQGFMCVAIFSNQNNSNFCSCQKNSECPFELLCEANKNPESPKSLQLRCVKTAPKVGQKIKFKI
jgi:hypothetical protein